MKSAVFYEPHAPITVEELDLEDPKSGEVMIEVVGAGACHSDYHFVDGHLSPPSVPYVLGHEGAGVVRKITHKTAMRAGILPNDFRNNSGMVGILDSIILGAIYLTKNRAAI